MIKKLFLLFFYISPLLLGGCASMKPQPIKTSEFPSDLWTDYEIVTSDFRLTDYNHPARRGDCPGQKIMNSTYPGASCVEIRNQHPEKNCMIVSSSFGNGYCPKKYSDDAYGRSTAKLDAITSAGTAAQNAVLAYGQAVSKRQQEDGLKFLKTYTLSTLIGSNVNLGKGINTIDTVISSNKEFSSGDILAFTRYGFYTDCLIIKSDLAYKVEMGNWYLRVLKDRPACKVPSNEKLFMPDYMNYKSSESGASFVYPYEVLQKKGAWEFRMVEPTFGMKAFSEVGLASPKDFEIKTGFASIASDKTKSIFISRIDDESVILTYVSNNGDSVKKQTFVLNSDNSRIQIDGLKLNLQSIKENKALVTLTGSFK